MTTAFQSALLGYLFQIPEAKQCIDWLDASVFNIPTYQLVYELWHGYVTKYNSLPPKPAFLEFTDREVRKSKSDMVHKVYSGILDVVAIAYTPIDPRYDFTIDIVTEFARRRGVKNFLTNNAAKVSEATVEDLDEMFNQFRRVVNIGTTDRESSRNRGGLLFRDGGGNDLHEVMMGHPTFLQGLNKMTAAGGFYAPQHILFVGGPKAFKTGTLITLAVEYARSGLNVFFADAENSIGSIKTRIKQCLLECERQEVVGYKRELLDIYSRIKRFGGDIYSHHFTRGSTLDAVALEIDRLSVEEDWRPQVIFYDPIYKFSSTNKYIKDETLRLQDLNAHAGRLNDKYNMFSFTAAKIKASAVHKFVIKQNDLALDFAGNYDAHAIFAINRTEFEEAAGFARITAVSQREGIGYQEGPQGTCAIKIVPETNTITELDAEAYLSTLQDDLQQSDKPTTAKRRYIPPTSLKDE